MEKSELKNYIEKRKDQYLDELFDLLKIPSISADPKYKDEIGKAADFLKNKLMNAGADNVEVHPTEGNPIVYAEKIVDPGLPTVLIYGHYDVQPPDPLELWKTEPFKPEIRDGKIYARGASDDKGQMYIHLKGFEIMSKENFLPCNVKFMLEGEEEIGSHSLEKFVKENKKKLDSDVILISDTAIISNQNPSITVGLKGLSYLEVEVTGPNRDLHSGVYGGAVDNPANVLCEIIAQLKDDDGVIQIPGFYDDVIDLSEEEREAYTKLPFDEEEYKNKLGLKALAGEKGYTTLERTSARPTLDVNGLWSGYQGEGAKTVLPAKAGAKVSMRLVPEQDPKEIAQLFKEHVESLAPDTVNVTVKEHHGGDPAITDLSFYGLQAAADAFEEVYDKEPFFTREGGSIPIVADFQKVLGAQSILMGFGLNSDAIHSPNEKFALKDFYRGIHTSANFFERLPDYG